MNKISFKSYFYSNSSLLSILSIFFLFLNCYIICGYLFFLNLTLKNFKQSFSEFLFFNFNNYSLDFKNFLVFKNFKIFNNVSILLILALIIFKYKYNFFFFQTINNLVYLYIFNIIYVYTYVILF